eukprot:TRINITY_DN2916_c2_g1_i1.p1 TRINITY_DN2916_c2_g1~~TRINITY_DN2916_c2_g1_i1.p1  ORF type:complete len:179 (+),score=22.07 TRINITY_DN2916_c2_g1_i1:219-755(+)
MGNAESSAIHVNARSGDGSVSPRRPKRARCSEPCIEPYAGPSLVDAMPPELMLLLLTFVDLVDLGRLARVCTDLRRLVDHDDLWRTQAERLLGLRHDQIRKPDARPWREYCQQFFTTPPLTHERPFSDSTVVACEVAIGSFFFGSNRTGPGLIGKFCTAGKESGIAKDLLIVAQCRAP